MKPRPLMKARDIAEEYGISRSSAEAIMRALGREDRLVKNIKIKGVWARREDVEESFQSSGGTT